MVAGVVAGLAELELELGRERRAAAREARRARGQVIGRPKKLDKSKAGLAQRMHATVAEVQARLGHATVRAAMSYQKAAPTRSCCVVDADLVCQVIAG
jgi:DNA invertase Pin-like site-specific DNA recombinase